MTVEKVISEKLRLLNQLDSNKTSRYPSRLTVIIERIKTLFTFRKKTEADILGLPIRVGKAREDRIQQLRHEIYTAAHLILEKNLSDVLVFRNMRDLLRHGITVTTPIDLAVYAVSLWASFQNVKQAQFYSNMAIQLAEKYDYPSKLMACLIKSNFIDVWILPYKECLASIKKAGHLQNGKGYNEEYACSIENMMFLAGNQLHVITKKQREIRKQLAFDKNNEITSLLNNLKKLILTLRGKYSSDTFQKVYSKFKKKPIHSVYYFTLLTYLIESAYFLNDWEAVLKLFFDCPVNIQNPLSQKMPNIVIYYFFPALVMLQRYNKASPENKRSYKKHLEEIIKKFKQWSQYSPENNLPLYNILLMGMNAFLYKKLDSVYALYEAALTRSRKYKVRYISSIANELLGNIYYDFNQIKNSIFYFQEAINDYQSWGCKIKVDELKSKYSDTVKTPSNVTKKSEHSVDSTDSIRNEFHTIDTITLLKAAQSISRHIKLDELLKSLMLTLIENAGAEHCVLLLLRNDRLWVEAEANINQNEPIVLQSKPVEDYTDISQAIVSYVKNTHQAIVLENASQKGLFIEDPYIKQRNVFSVLCSPVLSRDHTIGIVYLENNLTTSAFTPDRLEILKLLFNQAAISLENALYYSAHTQFVPYQFLELLNKDNILDVRLGDHVDKEMAILFMDIRQFTTLSESMEPNEVFQFINEYLSVMEPIIIKNNGFIDNYIGDAVLALFNKNPEDALQAGISMQTAVIQFNHDRMKKNKPVISFGVGINYGTLTLGTIGSKHRIQTSITGDAVELAVEIESLTKRYDSTILISDTLHEKLKNSNKNFCFRYVGDFSLKEKGNKAPIWEEYSGDRPEIYQAKRAVQSRYEKAILFFQDAKYEDALPIFQECSVTLPKDKLIEEYIRRCKECFGTNLNPNT